jgi:hypothetical protein
MERRRPSSPYLPCDSNIGTDGDVRILDALSSMRTAQALRSRSMLGISDGAADPDAAPP